MRGARVSVGLATALALWLARPAQAQRGVQSAILTGVVLRPDSTPAAYAGVEVIDAHQRRFANEDGKFSFRLAPGQYHVRVRQVGFAPRDTVVRVVAGGTPDLVIRMTAISVQLSAVTVKRSQFCTRPGVDSADDPILWAMFTAVRENALRELLLRRTYPFEYTVETQTVTTPASGRRPEKPFVDTLIYRSDAVMSYRRGGIVFTDRSDPRGAWERMRLPATVDFADSNFVSSHCFQYGNDESGDYSISFQPLQSITAPDVEGTVTLDTTTYVVHTATVRLTNAKAVAPGFERLEVHTTYREVIPKVALPFAVETTQLYHTPPPQSALFVAEESQTIRALRFIRVAPAGIPLALVFPLATGARGATSTP